MSGLPFWRGIARILSHESLRQEVRSFGRWSLVAPFVMAILFACGQVALVRPTGMAAADTGSLIQADYQAWPSQVFAPLVEEIIPEIQRENHLLPAQVVVPGDYYPGDSGAPPAAIPVALLETPPPAHDPVQSNPPSPATATPRSPPAQGSPASTPTPTRTVLPTPYPAPNRLPTSTLRPAATATRIPSQTPVPSPTRTRLPSATLTRTPTRTPTQFYPVQTSTATMTPSLTSSVTPSPSATQATATLTRTPTQTLPPSSTTTATSTFAATPTLTRTATPTQTSLPSMTPTSTFLPTTPWMPPNTNTPTFTPSPTDTPSPTPTNTSTPTPMPTSTDTPTPTSTDTPTPTALPLPPDIDIGDPDGEINDIQCGTGELVDLGAQVWIDTLILYEFYNPGGCNGGICLDWIYVDLSDSADGPWTQYFYWGDTNGGNNGNVEAYHFPGGVEIDNENIPAAELLNNSGILIGVGGTYRYVRLTAPTPCGDPAQVDSIDYWP